MKMRDSKPCACANAARRNTTAAPVTQSVRSVTGSYSFGCSYGSCRNSHAPTSSGDVSIAARNVSIAFECRHASGFKTKKKRRLARFERRIVCDAESHVLRRMRNRNFERKARQVLHEAIPPSGGGGVVVAQPYADFRIGGQLLSGETVEKTGKGFLRVPIHHDGYIKPHLCSCLRDRWQASSAWPRQLKRRTILRATIFELS